MNPASPVIPDSNLDEVKVAEHQPEYQTLPVIALEGGNILSRWAMDETEKGIVALTGELYICLMTFGQEPPETLFQVDNPLAPDTPDTFLQSKTAYPGTSLETIYRDETYIWQRLRLTDDDRATVARDGNVYFFMHNQGKPVTPSLVQVTNPLTESREVENTPASAESEVPPAVDYIIGIRKTEKAVAMAAESNIEIADYRCCVCDRATIVSKQIVARIEEGGARVICRICSEGTTLEICVLPETIAELKSVIENKNSQN